jgi:hypothetical protein
MYAKQMGKKKVQDERACPHSESLAGVFKFNCLAGICFSKATPSGSFVYLSIARGKVDIELHGSNSRQETRVQENARFLYTLAGWKHCYYSKQFGETDCYLANILKLSD